MPRIAIPVDENDVPAARDRLSKGVERLEVERKTIKEIRYPERFAVELGIAEGQGSAKYSGHKAVGFVKVPYAIVIIYAD